MAISLAFGVLLSAGITLFVVPTLINVCKLAHDHGIISVDLAKRAAATKVVPSPASTALDMDSHVGKHTLLFVVGDKFREQREEKQDNENPQGEVTPAVGFEIRQAPLVQGGHTLRVSKSMRGSTST